MELLPVTHENFRDVLELSVTPQQQAWVGTTAEALAHWHFYPEETPLAIYDAGLLVGFAMYRLKPSTFHLSRLLIDEGYQNRGLGRRALETLIELARHQPQVNRVELYVHVEAEKALRLYQARGFTLDPTGNDHFRATLSPIS